MEIIPFGEVLQDRYELSVKYKLIEKVGGIWRLTKKCKDNYEDLSYFYYLTGKLEKPEKINQQIPKQQKETPVVIQGVKPIPEKQMLINDLLQL